MITPVLAGLIERRILVNYAVDPDVAARLLPPPFRPQLLKERAVAGICLIRLTQLRPMGLPAWVGVASENAAHRIAVEWDSEDGVRSGVYIPRRDSGSALNVAVGGRLFPGAHHRARFVTRETSSTMHVSYVSLDGNVTVDVDVELTDRLEGSELFADIGAASAFFQAGSDGYSARADARLDGLSLHTDAWHVGSAAAIAVRSSFFEDHSTFPAGSAQLDSVLVMRRVPVSWHGLAGARELSARCLDKRTDAHT